MKSSSAELQKLLLTSMSDILLFPLLPPVYSVHDSLRIRHVIKFMIPYSKQQV